MDVEWPRATVAELGARGILLVEDGNHGEYRPRQHEFGLGGTAYIRAADLDDGNVLFHSAETISETALLRISKGVGRGGDILFSHKGTVGKVARVPLDAPPFVCSPQTTVWRTLDESQLDRRYLYAYLRSAPFREQWVARKGETDMADYVSLTAQRELEVVLPPLPQQRAIGSLLSALDDKIESNHRMNRTLEETASALFRSWFVDFDPVVAKAAGRVPFGMSAETAALFPSGFDESELGPIPRGWRAGRIAEIAENPRRGVAPADVAPSTPYFGLEHMPRRSISLGEWGSAADVGSGKFKFLRGEILFGKLRPYFHKVGVAPVDGVCSTDILVVIPKTAAWFGLLLGHVSSVEFIDHVDAASGGTRMPRTDWGTIGRYPIALPPADTAQALARVATAAVDGIVGAIHESRTLASLRDSLLPKLLSGEIRLRDAERAVEAAT